MAPIKTKPPTNWPDVGKYTITISAILAAGLTIFAKIAEYSQPVPQPSDQKLQAIIDEKFKGFEVKFFQRMDSFEERTTARIDRLAFTARP